MSQQNPIPYNFMSLVDKPLKYVVYGDSVAGEMKCPVIISNELLYLSFNEIWNKLINIGYTSEIINGKEYINNINELLTMCYNEKDDKIEMRSPKYLMRHKIQKEIVQLNLTNNDHLNITKDHSLLGYDGYSFYKLQPKDAHYVPIIRNQIPFDVQNDLDLLYFILGVWFADGTFSPTEYYPGFSLDNRDLFIDFIQQKDNSIRCYKRNNNNYDFQINYIPLKNILEQYNIKGSQSPIRIIPHNIFDIMKKNKCKFYSFIIGFYLGDGSFSSKGVQFNSSNMNLLKQVQELLMFYGMYSHIKIDKNGRHYNNKIKGDMYKLSPVGINNSLYTSLRSFSYIKKSSIPEIMPSFNYGPSKQGIYNVVQGFKNCNRFNVKPLKIQSKTEVMYDGYVYDFEIPDIHNFVVNGIVVHNTDSMYINIPELKPPTIEEAITHANNISKEINSLITGYLNTYLLPKMGVSPENNKTEFKTEYVCDALLLLQQKKTYAYHVLAREGKIMTPPIVEYKNIGIKSSSAKLTKEFLHTMIEQFVLNPEINPQDLKSRITKLASQMHDKIIECINNYEFQYIGIPKKWGTNYKDEDQQFQVIAMKLYNTILNEKVFTPMSSCLYLPISIDSPINFETKISQNKDNNEYFLGKTPITNITKLAFPYTYNKTKLKNAMDYFGIKIDVKTTWNTLYDKTVSTIVQIAHNYTQQSLMYGGV